MCVCMRRFLQDRCCRFGDIYVDGGVRKEKKNRLLCEFWDKEVEEEEEEEEEREREREREIDFHLWSIPFCFHFVRAKEPV